MNDFGDWGAQIWYLSCLYSESIRQDESWENYSIIPPILPLIHQSEEQNKIAVKILTLVSSAPVLVTFGLLGVLFIETLKAMGTFPNENPI